MTIKVSRTEIFESLLFGDERRPPEQLMLAAALIRAIRDLIDPSRIIRVSAACWFYEIDTSPDPRFTFEGVCEYLDLDKGIIFNALQKLGCFDKTPSKEVLSRMPTYGTKTKHKELWSSIEVKGVDEDPNNNKESQDCGTTNNNHLPKPSQMTLPFLP